MRWCEEYPARERRELWLCAAEHRDIKLVVHTRSMPERCGHEVICVRHEGQLMGLHNLTTGDRMNFVRSDPPLLWRRCDCAGVALPLLIACTSWCVSWPVVGAIAALWALLHASSMVSTRWVRRGLLMSVAEYAIASATRQATADRKLWRVK